MFSTLFPSACAGSSTSAEFEGKLTCLHALWWEKPQLLPNELLLSTLLHADIHRKSPPTLGESHRGSLPHLSHAHQLLQLVCTGYLLLPRRLHSCPHICSGALPASGVPIFMLPFLFAASIINGTSCCNATRPAIFCYNGENYEFLEEGKKSHMEVLCT